MATTTDDYTNIKKYGDAFSFTSKLADYSINPDWKSGYEAIANPNIYSDYKFLWQTVSASCEDIGGDIYKKILNYIDNISNIDTCEIHALQSFAKMYGFNESLLFMNFSFPNEILELVNVFSINKAYLTGPNSVLTPTSITDIAALSGDDAAYIQYINGVIYNTLLDFCNLQYRVDELTQGVTTTIWQNNTAKYSVNLFSPDNGVDSSIMLKKIALNVPMYFPERQYADNIQNGTMNIINFTAAEQVIINMELARRTTAQNAAQNISKYSYARENKVTEYFKFITLMANNTFTTIPYEIDITKAQIISENLQGLLVYNSVTNTYSLNTDIIQNVTKYLVDLCLRISYIRETIKAQAQKYYMSGTEELLVNMVKEVLFSTVYNNINSADGYWRYTSTNNKTLLEKNIQLNPNFEVDVIEYTDPTEYFNIAANSTESITGITSGINSRYWETVTALDGDITTDELLTFYNRLGLGDLFTNTYATSSSALTSTQYGALSSYSLSGFLGTLFNAGATSATSSTIYTPATSSFGISSANYPLPVSGWGSVTIGPSGYSSNTIYMAPNSLSGVYSSYDGMNWTPVPTLSGQGWVALTYGTNYHTWIALNSITGIYYSSDGVIWNKETSTGISTNWVNIVYGSNISSSYRYFAINNTQGIWYSVDGITWTKVTLPAACGPNGWTDIAYSSGGGYYLASNYIYGLFYSTDATTFAKCTISSNNINAGWIAITDSGYSENHFTAINAVSGIYFASNYSPFTCSTSTSGLYTNWIDITHGTPVGGSNDIYFATNSISGIFWSQNAGNTWQQNHAVSNYGWSTIDWNNDIYFAQNILSGGLCYSPSGSGLWYPVSGTFLTSGTYVIPGSAYTDPASAVFAKYSSNPVLGVMPYGNIKNTIHSSYQLHPFLLAFKQYSKAMAGIQNLFDTAIPDRTTIYTNIQNRIDNLGNTVNYWLDNNIDCIGYTSKYEQSIKNGNKLLDLDLPFNFDALNLYYSAAPTFSGTDTPVASAYYSFLDLTPTAKTVIANQLNTFFYNIMELANYSLYRYGQDTFGNVYMLYKKINSFDQCGQLWIRLKDHPIPFPAFIPDSNEPSQLSNLGQITSTTLNTLSDVINNRYQIDNPAPISGTMQFNNVTMTVSGTTGPVNNFTITSLNVPVSVQYTFQTTQIAFNTINISGNSQLSAYFINDFTGYINGNTVSFPTGFTPTLSSPSVSSSPNYITLNSGNILLNSSSYINTTVNIIGNNVFTINGVSTLFNPKLDAFYDFGFNYSKDILYLDYSPAGTKITSYANSNTMFGYINNSNVDANGNILLQFLKETTHNLETIPQSLIQNFIHVDTIINEKDIFFIYVQNVGSPVSVYVFKYNKIDGLDYRLYSVPVQYDIVTNSEWKATVSNSMLSVAFMSQNPIITDTIGNYVSGTVASTNTLSGGQTSFSNILPTSYLNGITVIQFNIANGLPLTYNTVKYFYKQTDLGFYPQYYGPAGKNNFYANPVINTTPYYNLQLYISPANIVSKDSIYEQTFNNSPTISSIYTDMLAIDASLISSLNSTDFLYTTASYPFSSSSLSSDPMKWFRKFDLSGTYPLSSQIVSTGVDLSLTTLSPSSYLYNNDELTFTQYNSSFFPQILQTNTSINTYGLLELDENYTIQVTYLASDSAVDSINTLSFQAISGDITNTVSLSTVGQPANFVYIRSGIPKTYIVKLINATKKQFSITRA